MISWTICTEWKLNVNITKTKVQIFGARKLNPYQFYINNTKLEIVDHNKYLGVYFSKTGSFNKTKTHLSEQANKALHFLYTRINNLNLPVDLILKLFDHTILPILSYSSEIWGGYGNFDQIERIHKLFLRYITKHKKSKPIYMLMGGLGRYPIEVTIKSRMIGY